MFASAPNRSRPLIVDPKSLSDFITAPGAEAVTDQRLVKLYRYWVGKRGTRAMPSRQDIDPAEIVDLLPYLFMADVERNPWRFRYRLVGTGIVEFTGRDLTGHSLDEGDYGEFTEAALQLFKGVAVQRVPFAVKGRAVWLPGRDWQDIELLCLPLGVDENNPDIVLGGYITKEKAVAGEAAARVPAYERLRVIPRPQVGSED